MLFEKKFIPLSKIDFVTEEEKLSIFIVEDDEFYQEHLRHHIASNFDCHLKIFRSGEACLDSLYLKPDVIFLDYSLNDDVIGAINGMEVLTRIRKKNPSAKVVMVSGYTKEKEIKEKLLQAGAYDFIAKDDGTLKSISYIIEKSIAEKNKKKTNGIIYKMVSGLFLFLFR